MNATPGSPILTTGFSLAHLEPAGRFEVWREILQVMGFDSQPMAQTTGLAVPFHAEGTMHHLSSVLLGDYCCTGQPHSRSRSQRLIAQDGFENFAVNFITQASRIQGEWRGRNQQVNVGDLLLTDMTQPARTQWLGDAQGLYLMIPRALLARQFPHIGLHHGAILPRKSVYGQLLSSHLQALFRLAAQGMATTEAEAASQGLASLVGHYFSQIAPQEGDPRLEATLRDSIRHYIRQHLADPTLGPEHIAAQFRMSRSYLYQLFAGHEGGIACFILEQRLQQAFRQLVSPNHRQRRISDIAYGLGFNSNEQFSRHFRRHFGITPTEARHLAVQQAPKASRRDGVDWSYSDWIQGLC